jgi:hypothetical protein
MRSAPIVRNPARGATLVDVMLAMFIFCLVGVPLMESLMAASRIGGRADRLAGASMLAWSETERIRAIAACKIDIRDTSYEATVKNLRYRVVRARVSNTGLQNDFAKSPNAEIEIRIAVSGREAPLLTFRILQGAL